MPPCPRVAQPDGAAESFPPRALVVGEGTADGIDRTADNPGDLGLAGKLPSQQDDVAVLADEAGLAVAIVVLQGSPLGG